MTALLGLGYRQRTLLDTLRRAGHPVRTGYLVRISGADPKTVNVALVGLRDRGLVEHVSRGRWAAAC